MMEGWQSRFDEMCNEPNPPDRDPVSAHFSIGKDGTIHRHVAYVQAAWHAGVVDEPTWPGLTVGVSPNWYTIGIEMEGFVSEGMTAGEIASAIYLLRLIWRDCGIEPIYGTTVIRHSMIDGVNRANDPGPLAPIEYIAEQAHERGPLP